MLLTATSLIAAWSYAQTTWPLQQAGESDQWFMTTFELLDYVSTGQTFHAGIDIVGVPFDGDTPGDVAVVVADGAVCWGDNATHFSDDNDEAWLTVLGDSGVERYHYNHLDPNQLADFNPIDSSGSTVGACGSEICAGTGISGLFDRSPAERPHLHFEYAEGACDSVTRYLDPNATLLDPAVSLLDPYVDTQPPTIGTVKLCDDDVTTATASGTPSITAWNNCVDLEDWTCASIDATPRDLLVNVYDTHHAPDGEELKLGVRKLEWCVASPFHTNCGWNATFDFGANGLPVSWTTTYGGPGITDALFSFASPHISYTHEDTFGNDLFWVIASNGDDSDADIDPNPENYVDLTSAGSSPVLAVRATDFDGLVVTKAHFFCMEVAPVIRDCEGDLGHPIYVNTCGPDDDGPDVFFVYPVEDVELPEFGQPRMPGTPPPLPLPIREGTEIPVRVCMTARGPAGSTLSETLTLALHLGRAYPGFADRQNVTERFMAESVGERTVTVPELVKRDGTKTDAPWKPGQERCADIPMTLPVTIRSERDVAGLSLYATVWSRTHPLRPPSDTRRDPRKSKRSLRKMVAELAENMTRDERPASREQ